MATFTAEVFQNEFLPDGGREVHAIVAVTCTGAGRAAETGVAGEVIIVDTSGSMENPSSKIRSARKAAAAAIAEIDDGTWFGVIAGTDAARLVFPERSWRDGPMVVMDAAQRSAALAAVRNLDAGGGTAIGSWLRLARQMFQATPEVAQAHAILLTDGRNESERPRELAQEIEQCKGVFQCDARGVGSDWDVNELRGIATALLGTVDVIADPEEMAADFEAMMRNAMGRGVSDATLRVWAPQGAELLFVRQVSPEIVDLTNRRQQLTPLISAFPTGAWGDETREYHVAVRVPAKPVGSEQLAARVQLCLGDDVQASGLVKALWSDDATLTTRINPAVAHYTGQAELANAIQEGLAAKAAGDDRTATAKLGRAVQLAAETGNDEATARLKKVVDVVEVETGTVRLKKDVAKVDEMALDTRSTKTTLVR